MTVASALWPRRAASPAKCNDLQSKWPRAAIIAFFDRDGVVSRNRRNFRHPSRAITRQVA
ncbi:hypothetical protein B1F85_31595 (plasmid) [Pseudomonas syringae pv. actinidiae]|nr:hypothetical protein B1R35_31560 [Pseudomonas syringae pv. actinidiae]AQX68446.1 hypothetical protein B1F85_31595 [Pseudomonas syringae pv. actinidiae]